MFLCCQIHSVYNKKKNNCQCASRVDSTNNIKKNKENKNQKQATLPDSIPLSKNKFNQNKNKLLCSEISFFYIFYIMFFLLFQKKTDESLELYRQALEAAKGQKELELMNLYEIGNHSFHIKKNGG